MAVSSYLDDRSCLELAQLILESAAIDSAEPVMVRCHRRLLTIAESDPVFRQWLLANSNIDLESALQSLADQFPDSLLEWSRPPLPLSETIASCNMMSSVHLVLRVRAMERAYKVDSTLRQNETLYHFAYGLSHELNNPLANISTRAGFLARSESDKARKIVLEAIVEHTLRGSEMLGDLMLVARPPQLEQSTVSVPAFFDELIQQALSWAERFAIQLTSDNELEGQIQIDAAAMREALWCLIRNAIEALDEGGEIHLAVCHSAGERLRVEIRDNGPGLSAEALQHCFDPFYCGREAGRGLGVGLTKARRIVELHRGDIRVANLPGGGCSTVIEIPVWLD